MKRSEKADSSTLPSTTDVGTLSNSRRRKGPGKQIRKAKKFGTHTKKRTQHPKAPVRGSGIREAEEARALLEDQLHNLYWWVFNAFKMKGFIRAKALQELHSANDEGSSIEKDALSESDRSPENKGPN
jgi:hypothetical protein